MLLSLEGGYIPQHHDNFIFGCLPFDLVLFAKVVSYRILLRF